MRALLRDRLDHSLIALEVEQVCYDENAQELYLSSPDYDYFVSMVKVNADSFILELYENGKADLTQYGAAEINN